MAQAARKTNSEWEARWYTHESAAPEHTQKEAREPRRESEIKPAPQSELKIVPDIAPKRHFFKTLLCIALAFGLLSTVVSRYAAISTNNLENNSLQENIDKLETEISILEADLKESSRIALLPERAEALGMSIPGNDRVRYIEIEVPVRAEKPAEQSGFDIFDLLSGIRSIFE